MSEQDDEREVTVRFRRIMPVGSGGARQVYAGLIGEGMDAIMTELAVYAFTEGFSRAAGNAPADYMRLHEHLHRGVGADLPDGLTAEALRQEALSIMKGDAADGLTFAAIEAMCIERGREFHAAAMSPRTGP